MKTNRRSFLESSALMPLLLATKGANWIEVGDQTPDSSPQETIDQATLNFWESKVRETTDNIAKGVYTAGPVQTPAFVFYDETAQKFHLASDIDDGDLPASGDGKVMVTVEHFRPSVADAAKFQNSQTGTLRLDVGQINSPNPGLADALAWTAVAAFVPKATGLPSLDKLSFNPGQSWDNPQNIPMPGGCGYWSWNLFVKKPQHFWSKVLNLFIQVGSTTGVVSVLGLPAIALTALKSVDKILGYVQSADSSNWVLQSQNTPFYLTKAGKDQVGSVGLRLKSGTLLIMPQAHLSVFGQAVESEKLVIQKGGYLVPGDTTEFNRINAAQSAAKDVTYFLVSVNATATPASANKPATPASANKPSRPK